MDFLKLIKAQSNITCTENGAVTYKSTNSHCLDLFYMIGALRNADNEYVCSLTERAYTEDADKTMRILFFARDIRSGLGERKVFRSAMAYLAKTHPESVIKNLELFPEYGRWDDLVELCAYPRTDKKAVEIIRRQLSADVGAMTDKGNVSLMAKWMPSVNTSSEMSRIKARRLAKHLGMSEREYRTTLSSLRRYIDIIENRLREKDYTFDYSKEPSRAMFKYRRAFLRNDGERYRSFIMSVTRGEKKLNAGTLYPYDIVCRAFDSADPDETAALNASWLSLNDIKTDRNAIAVIDGSGSMYCSLNPRPADAALSLGLYFAEHSKGAFAGHFITFSETPQLVEIKGDNIIKKVRYAASFSEVANTDIQAVFDLILDTAKKNRLPQSELPEQIFIISDMEFDYCVVNGSEKLTNFDAARRKFESCGYKLPQVIFWNVAACTKQVPVTMHESGAALVSGFSPKIFDMVKSGDMDPTKLMDEINFSERYAAVSA